MITDIFNPQFNIASLPIQHRLTPLFQLFGLVGKTITHDEFLDILNEWFFLIEMAESKRLVN